MMDPYEKNRWAFYIRLSREDGDRAESLSVVHQKLKLSEYAKTHPELTPYSWYIDDGYTGTNYDRPAFLRLLQDIEAGHICGVFGERSVAIGKQIRLKQVIMSMNIFRGIKCVLLLSMML